MPASVLHALGEPYCNRGEDHHFTGEETRVREARGLPVVSADRWNWDNVRERERLVSSFSQDTGDTDMGLDPTQGIQ